RSAAAGRLLLHSVLLQAPGLRACPAGRIAGGAAANGGSWPGRVSPRSSLLPPLTHTSLTPVDRCGRSRRLSSCPGKIRRRARNQSVMDVSSCKKPRATDGMGTYQVIFTPAADLARRGKKSGDPGGRCPKILLCSLLSGRTMRKIAILAEYIAMADNSSG